MTRPRTPTKPHLNTKPRPQAPQSKEKPTPSRPNISPEEAARRSHLTPAERSAEALDASRAAESQHEGELWKCSPSSEEPSSSSRRSASDQEKDAAHMRSFFSNSRPAFFDAQGDPIPFTGSASSYFFGTGESQSGPQYTRKATRQEEKKERQRRAQAEQDAKREQEYLESEYLESSPPVDDEYWAALLLSQQRDKKEWGMYYLVLVADLRAFKSSRQDGVEFPALPNLRCPREDRLKGELIGCCHHDLEKVFRGSGMYSREWLRRERHQWHPDKFSRLGQNAVERSTEVFKLCQKLLETKRCKFPLLSLPNTQMNKQ
ncbi:uncharacterized protein LY89DRAFT_57884 [Mollisia scopiformis]|uniref:Uncharacterized protein n=1 Tax=Mollisia scopiformis TaxID=149040 RepID=A0A194XBP8_MOLSC|nr:uncharacterized protein LY89DRAFT_57884 [Mollisia scopiformis]KUJ17591.1 hypothetical protein LY89DRAFT_57884 [Mollisia scopiformis]